MSVSEPFTYAIWLSLDGKLDKDVDLKLDIINVPMPYASNQYITSNTPMPLIEAQSIAMFQSSQMSINLTYCGPIQAIFEVDAENAVVESTKENNVMATNIIITCPNGMYNQPLYPKLRKCYVSQYSCDLPLFVYYNFQFI